MRLEDYLAENGELTYSNVGNSMMPLLRQHRDLLTVKRKGRQRCRPGDVVLYRRPSDTNKYILHRVVRVLPDSYVILGDNCAFKEYGITDSSILGIMTGYVRRGREHTVNDISYRLYSFYIMHTIPVRTVLKKLIYRAKRLAGRMIYGKK